MCNIYLYINLLNNLYYYLNIRFNNNNCYEKTTNIYINII